MHGGPNLYSLCIYLPPIFIIFISLYFSAHGGPNRPCPLHLQQPVRPPPPTPRKQQQQELLLLQQQELLLLLLLLLVLMLLLLLQQQSLQHQQQLLVVLLLLLLPPPRPRTFRSRRPRVLSASNLRAAGAGRPRPSRGRCR